MKSPLLYLFLALTISMTSCKKDDDAFPYYLKGIVKFHMYELNSGPQPLMYSDNEIRFMVDLQLGGSTKRLDIDMGYHLLDGTQKIGEGTVRVNIRLDAGLGIYWGSDENYIPVDGAAMRGKTLTVFLDPDNEYTANRYSNDIYIEKFKKASIIIR